jgi:hypothetical protein
MNIINDIARRIVNLISKEPETITAFKVHDEKKTPKAAPPNMKAVAGQKWEADDSDVWQRRAYNGVSPELTAAQTSDLLVQGLDLGKALIIKSLMDGKRTQEIVSGLLQKEHGRGFSVSTISPYWKILSPSPATPIGVKEGEATETSS